MLVKKSAMRPLRIVAALVAMLTITACTSSLIYNRLDTVARWYIGNLVTLDDTQQAALRDWLSRTLAWHRDTELSRYEAFLVDLAEKVSSGPDPERFPAAMNQAEGFMRELAAQVAPEAATLLLTLDSSQVDELMGNLEERNREELEEEQERTPAVRQKRRVRSVTRSLERWTGTATVEQKALIERVITEMNEAGLLGESEAWFASQEAWRSDLRAALAMGPEGKANIEALLRDPEQSHTAAHREATRSQRRQFTDLIIGLDALLTPKQRMTFSTRLFDLAQDLKALQPDLT